MTKLYQTISLTTCRSIFYDTLQKLSTILQAMLTWVPKEEILRNLPKCFKNYSETVCVIDCTEVHIQAPKCLKCRIKFYSNYKSDFTVKFMVGTTPAGIIHFLSDSYGGRVSNKAIFSKNNLLSNTVSTRDAVMVDKGFLIDEECEFHRIKLIRPPFKKDKEQFSEEEAIQTKKIAAARVHVERMNARIKVMEVLNGKMDWHLVQYSDDIFTVCCGLANLGTPILADDKF